MQIKREREREIDECKQQQCVKDINFYLSLFCVAGPLSVSASASLPLFLFSAIIMRNFSRAVYACPTFNTNTGAQAAQLHSHTHTRVRIHINIIILTKKKTIFILFECSSSLRATATTTTTTTTAESVFN